MTSIETWYRARIEFDYNQHKVERDDFAALELAEAEGREPAPPRDVIEEIEAEIGKFCAGLDVQFGVQNGGPAWSPYIELEGQSQADMERAVKGIERILREHDYTELSSTV